MPIIEATNTYIIQKCSRCTATRRFELDGSTVVLGYTPPGYPASFKDAIKLPLCPCGSSEQLMRTFDRVLSGISGPSVDHKKLVNSLGELLKVLGHVAPECAAQIAAETEPPAELLPSALSNVPVTIEL